MPKPKHYLLVLYTHFICCISLRLSSCIVDGASMQHIIYGETISGEAHSCLFFIWYMSKILCCKCNELQAFDHVRIFVGFSIVSSLIMCVNIEYISSEGGGVWLWIINLLGVVTGIYIFIWYLIESYVREQNDSRWWDPPVLVSGVHAVNWCMLF